MTSYKSLRSTIDKSSKKLETMKTTSTTGKKSCSRKMDRVESSLKKSTRDLSLFKFKFGVVVALVLFIVFGLLNSLFEGKLVMRSPSNPMGSFTIQKFLGFFQPRAAVAMGGGLFPMLDPKTI